MPDGEEIFLDHVGHFVRDPEDAAAALKRAGFAPTPMSVQVAPDGGPTGTGNVCAMFARGYVEVLFKTADTALGREFEAALARHSGVQLAAFAVADAGAFHRRLGEAGFRTRPLASFQRPVGTEAGTATAAFTVARVEAGEMAEGRIQALTHHTEDAVWQPRWLTHPNGALGLASLVIAVADVDEAAAPLCTLHRPAGDADAFRTTRAARPRTHRPCTPRRICSDAAGDRDSVVAVHGRLWRDGDIARCSGGDLRNGGISLRRVDACLIAPFPQALGHGAWLFSTGGHSLCLAEASYLDKIPRNRSATAGGVA